MDLTNNGKNGWGLDASGRIILDTKGVNLPTGIVEKNGILTTKGDPKTMGTMRREYGELIGISSRFFDIPSAWIAGMITIEALRIKGTLSFDPISLRDEDGQDFAHWDKRPNRVSAGLMQTLVSTARQMAEKHNTHPVWNGRPVSVDLGHLTIPEVSIFLGAAYMRDRADKYGMDPIKIVAAYNAGGVYADSGNPWNLRTYGLDRIPKFAAYTNDWLRGK